MHTRVCSTGRARHGYLAVPEVPTATCGLAANELCEEEARIMSSVIGKRRREMPSTSSPPGSAVSEFSSMHHPAPKRLARGVSTPRGAALGDDEPPEVGPEDEEELLEALRTDDTSHPGSAGCRSPSANKSAGADPADVTTWFPREPEAASGLPKRLYAWQAQCLAVRGVAEGTRSLVYAAPTSGGKTLVAEILMLKAILAKGKVLFVQPFVALVKEKEISMKQLLRPIHKRVSAFYGKHRPHLRFDAAICTFEKALLLSTLMQQEGRLHELKLVVVDELHMIRDDYRGYILEILLTKLRYMSSLAAQQAGTAAQSSGPQVVAMSATVPNLTALASWLDAEVFQTDFRPVTLGEFVVVHSRDAGSGADGQHRGSDRAGLRQQTTARVFHAMTQHPARILQVDSSDANATNSSGSTGRIRPYSADLAAVSCLCREVSCCLVFCAVKKKCEEAAEWIASAARHRAGVAARHSEAAAGRREHLDTPEPVEAQQWIDIDGAALSDEMVDHRRDLLEHLSQLPHPMHKLLRQVIPVGVAFHHSGTQNVGNRCKLGRWAQKHPFVLIARGVATAMDVCRYMHASSC